MTQWETVWLFMGKIWEVGHAVIATPSEPPTQMPNPPSYDVWLGEGWQPCGMGTWAAQDVVMLRRPVQ